MARSKAQRDRDREDLLLAIDELGPRANTTDLALAMDSTYRGVIGDLNALVRAGHVDGRLSGFNAGAPSVLVAYGRRDAEVLEREPLPGHYVELRRTTP